MFQRVKDFMFPQPYGGIKQEEIPAEFSDGDFTDIKYRDAVVLTMVGLLGTQTEGTNFFVGMGGGIHDIVWSVFDVAQKEYKGVAYPEELTKMLGGIDKSQLGAKEVRILTAFEKILHDAHGIQVERIGNKGKVREVLSD